jgi:small subunit ribosomal protein S5
MKKEESPDEPAVITPAIVEEDLEKAEIGAVVAAKKEEWNPRTSLGKKVKSGEISDIGQILDNGYKIMEQEIVDILVPNLEADLIMIGQAKGKFGGGQKRVFNQTQKKTNEGNKPSFSTCIIVGNKDGYVGMGIGKGRETVPAREKALRKAKLNVIKIRRGCGSWVCGCREPHTIPFKVSGKCGSIRMTIMPAPKGTGLKIQSECQKLLAIAGIKDVWSKTKGQTRSSGNLARACFSALRHLMETKVPTKNMEELGVQEGKAASNNGATV